MKEGGKTSSSLQVMKRDKQSSTVRYKRDKKGRGGRGKQRP